MSDKSQIVPNKNAFGNLKKQWLPVRMLSARTEACAVNRVLYGCENVKETEGGFLPAVAS